MPLLLSEPMVDWQSSSNGQCMIHKTADGTGGRAGGGSASTPPSRQPAAACWHSTNCCCPHPLLPGLCYGGTCRYSVEEDALYRDFQAAAAGGDGDRQEGEQEEQEWVADDAGQTRFTRSTPDPHSPNSPPPCFPLPTSVTPMHMRRRRSKFSLCSSNLTPAMLSSASLSPACKRR